MIPNKKLHLVSNRDDSRHRAIYLLPNAFTTAALFCGFYAIIQAINGVFDKASLSIFAAMVLDGLDGRVARLTRTQSAFGEQYDSLSDMVSFGVAPAILSYEWILHGLGKWGWLVCFIYCSGAALRLARFNTNIDIINKSFFQGLPSPAAAAAVAGFIWLSIDKPEIIQFFASNNISYSWVLFALTMYVGLSMVSNIPFYSFKSIAFVNRVPFSALVLFLFIFAGIAIEPAAILFLLFLSYALSGFIVLMFYKLIKKGNPVKVK